MTARDLVDYLILFHGGMNFTHLSLNAGIVADFIQVICGHTRLYRRGSNVKDFSS